MARGGGHWTKNFRRSGKDERTSADGITHDSIAEMNRWCQLRLLESQGRIRNLRRAVKFPLVIPASDGHPATPVMTKGGGQVASYKADFVYERDGEEIIEESKGFMADDAILKIRVFEAIYRKKVFINTGKAKASPQHYSNEVSFV